MTKLVIEGLPHRAYDLLVHYIEGSPKGGPMDLDIKVKKTYGNPVLYDVELRGASESLEADLQLIQGGLAALLLKPELLDLPVDWSR